MTVQNNATSPLTLSVVYVGMQDIWLEIAQTGSVELNGGTDLASLVVLLLEE